MEQIKKIIDLIDKSIKDDPNNNITEWNIITDWYDSEVDEMRSFINNSKDWLANYQAEIAEKNGISNLKIKYTNVSGYFIEVPKSQMAKCPDNFVHKQTLVNAVRYITSELKVFEEKMIEGESKLYSREYEIFWKVREEILESFVKIKELSTKTATLDMVSALSRVAYNNNYSRPEIITKDLLKIEGWRHPVIEQIEKNFISNDLFLDSKNYIDVITWPNMWGKSTFLRQNALIVLLAHIGSFVPAKSAQIPLTDKIFSRVGANDNLFLGQSTFMVEMQEMAYILNNATGKSFVIIDEIWRWTSTYDGMSLAWGILKYLHDKTKSKTLFATHYHELVDESNSLKSVENFSVSVWENEDGIVFLRKVIKWWIKKSYGLEVAKLAWVSTDILNQAKIMLKKMEANNEWKQMSIPLSNFPPEGERIAAEEPEIVYKEKDSVVENKLKEIDVNNLTPMEALNLLNELKDEI